MILIWGIFFEICLVKCLLSTFIKIPPYPPFLRGVRKSLPKLEFDWSGMVKIPLLRGILNSTTTAF